MSEILFEIFVSFAFIFCCFILLRFIRSESKRAEERQRIFLESLKSISYSLEHIRKYSYDFICEYVKPKD